MMMLVFAKKKEPVCSKVYPLLPKFCSHYYFYYIYMLHGNFKLGFQMYHNIPVYYSGGFH